MERSEASRLKILSEHVSLLLVLRVVSINKGTSRARSSQTTPEEPRTKGTSLSLSKGETRRWLVLIDPQEVMFTVRRKP